jgi:hypothetical protein
LWILDPVSRLGHRFYLGELFRYDGPGFWFGLPLGSQLGFAATAAILLATLFTMARAEPPRPVDGIVHHPRLAALITYNAQVAHLAIVAFVIGGVPADTIGGSFFLMWIPAGAITAVLWSHLRTERARSEPSEAQARVPAPR